MFELNLNKVADIEILENFSRRKNFWCRGKIRRVQKEYLR